MTSSGNPWQYHSSPMWPGCGCARYVNEPLAYLSTFLVSNNSEIVWFWQWTFLWRVGKIFSEVYCPWTPLHLPNKSNASHKFEQNICINRGIAHSLEGEEESKEGDALQMRPSSVVWLCPNPQKSYSEESRFRSLVAGTLEPVLILSLCSAPEFISRHLHIFIRGYHMVALSALIF